MDRIIIINVAITIIFSIVVSCVNRVNDKNTVDIVKVGEIVIKFPSFYEKTIPHTYSGIFPQSFGVIDSRYIIYKKNYDYFYIDMVSKSSKKICMFGFDPGNSPYFPTGLSIADDKKIIISDLQSRINIYDKNGEFLESYVLPSTLGGNWTTTKIKDMLIKSRDQINSINLSTGNINEIFAFNSDDLNTLMVRTPADGNIYSLYFNITPDGNLLIAKAMEPFIYEYSIEGNLIHKYEEIPPHYVSISDIEPYKKRGKYITTDWDKEQNKDQYGYHDKWSFSGTPYIFKNEYFVISRRVYPPIYLDFYSLQSKKYLGYYNIGNKTLLYADDKYIYLHNDSKNKEFIVEKYEVSFNTEGRRNSSNDNIEKLVFFINESESDKPKKNLYGLINEKEYKNTGSITSINDILIKNLNGEDELLMSYLNKGKKYHFIVNVRVLCDCGLTNVISDIKNFCQDNPEFDYNLLFTHPFKEELKRSIRFFRFDVDPIFNIEPKRVFGFYSKSDDSLYPSITISLVDNEGNFFCNWKDDNFFKDVAKRFGLG
ncbi:MAG TPA: hypothetical protein PLN58_06460 [Bacilli bacterium]|nr:hypothetical protein [Clostridiales bacterium]HQP14311.1 hypothetical protein [Bacilli bacterium]